MKYGYQLVIGSLRSKVYATQKELFEAMAPHVGDTDGLLNVAGAEMRVLRVTMK